MSPDRRRLRASPARGRDPARSPGRAAPGRRRAGPTDPAPIRWRSVRAISSRAAIASGARASDRARPGRPPDEPGEPGRERRIREVAVLEDGFDLADGDRAEPEAGAARPDSRHQAVLVVRAEDDRHAGGRLLERLEERRLGVVAHPVGPLEDRDAGAALDRAAARDPAPGAGSCRPRGGPGCRCGSGRRGRPARGAGRRDGSRDRPAGSRDRPGTAGRPDPGRRRAGRPPGRARASSCRSRPARRSAGRAARWPATIARTAATARSWPRVRNRPAAGWIGDHPRSPVEPGLRRGRPSCGSPAASAWRPGPRRRSPAAAFAVAFAVGRVAPRLRSAPPSAASVDAAAVVAGFRVVRRLGAAVSEASAPPGLGRRRGGRGLGVPASGSSGASAPSAVVRERIVRGRCLDRASRRLVDDERSGAAGRRLAGLGQLRPEHLLELRRDLAPGVAARRGPGARRARAGPGAGSRCRDRRHAPPGWPPAAALAIAAADVRDSG